MRAGIVAVVSAVLATAVHGIEAPIPGYGVEEFTWEVQAFVDGPKFNITGPIEKVYAQLTELNPNYDADFASILANTPNDESSSLEKRFGPECDVYSKYGWAQTRYIRDGISYLRGVAGQPTNGPGPGNCGRVSCSWSSAIWWCNDNTTPFTLPSFSTIADCAQVTVDDCTVWRGEGSSSPWQETSGQNFNGYNWNCIVDWGDC